LSILADTDILSAFSKIKELDLLKELFPDEDILIPNGVFE
jgi:predicted nucleic acid-binding protein